MAQWQDEVVEAISGGADADPYVTREGGVASICHCGYRGSTAVLRGGSDSVNVAACASDSPATLTATGSKIHSLRSGGVEKAYIDKDGNFNGGIAGSYGGAYESNETGSAIALTSNAAFYKWVTATAGTVRGAPYITFDNGAGNKHLVVGASGAGIYLVNCHFAGTLGAANELRAAIFKNELEQANLRVDQDISTLAKYQPGSITGLLALAEGDIVSLRFGSDANSQTFTIKHANLTLVRVG